MIVRPLVVAVALACIVALVAKTALHYALSLETSGEDDDSKRVGRRGSLVESKREEELDEDEPGYAAFFEERWVRGEFFRGVSLRGIRVDYYIDVVQIAATRWLLRLFFFLFFRSFAVGRGAFARFRGAS